MTKMKEIESLDHNFTAALSEESNVLIKIILFINKIIVQWFFKYIFYFNKY